MNIIDNHNLLADRQLELLQKNAANSFNFGGFQSLDDILTLLKVDVLVEPGVISRSTPNFFDEAEEYWREEVERLKELVKYGKSDEKMKELNNANNNFERVVYEKRVWSLMSLRGLYDPSQNIIKLYPDEMRQEYGGNRIDELLLSTLAHETMHAYFNRPGHDNFSYVLFVEEPLAEFGMLLYMYNVANKSYQWAFDDVSNKSTCYKYGANLMTQCLNEGASSPTRQYLESYKIQLNIFTMLVTNLNNITMSQFSSTSSAVNVNGQNITANWHNLINLPSYFWDPKTQTLGLDGDWTMGLMNKFEVEQRLHEVMALSQGKVQNIYLSDNFCVDNNCITNEKLIEFATISVSPSNTRYKMQNGIVMTNYGKVAPIYPSCGCGYFSIPQNGKWGIVDDKGNVIVGYNYDSIWSFDDNGLCMVRKDTSSGYLYGYVNKAGQEQIPVDYEYIYSFENGVTVAKKNGVYGIIDENDNIVCPFNLYYSDMRAIRNGYATMKDNTDKWGAIDSKGNVVVPCTYDSQVIFDENGIASVSQNGADFKIDKFGNKI